MRNNGTLTNDFISFMIDSGALLFGDFTLKSGRKSPYFINTGEYKTGAQLSRLGDFYAKLIGNSMAQEPALKFNVLFGPAYKGIPLATITAAKLAQTGLDLFVSYNRKEQKDHGEGSRIMGYCPKNGDKIAIIEDVTTAGTSIRETIALLKDMKIDAEITALYISIDRMERGSGTKTAIAQLKEELGINVYSIATVRDVIEYCKQFPNTHEHAEAIERYLEEHGGVS